MRLLAIGIAIALIVPLNAFALTPAVMTPQKPLVQDISGNPLSVITSGQQVVINTNHSNETARELEFVVIIEVRDSDNTTVFLALQSGTLEPNGRTAVGTSWTAGEPSAYFFRTFTISGLQDPSILSAVAEAEIIVN